MELSELPEKEFDKVKETLITQGTIFEIKKVKDYDVKYFEIVTLSNILIKFFLFISLGLYAVINLIGIILSIVYNSYNLINPIETIVAVFIICFIIFAIFNNINTKKKKEQNIIYIKDNNFIFNFRDGIVETPTLFYSLPYDSIQKIEFLIHKLKKQQIFGSVTFTFKVLDYTVIHIIRFTNLSEIEKLFKSRFSILLDKLFIDGKSIKDRGETIKNENKVKYFFIALVVFIISILLVVIPSILNFNSLALIISSVILLVTSLIVFLSSYLYIYHLVQGIIISGIFLIMGFCMPLLIIEISGIPFIDYIIQNSQILLTTIFGIIGLCLYFYILTITIGKISYKIRNKKAEI